MGLGIKILLVFVGGIALVAIVLMMLPSGFDVERSETIKAPQALVHAYVSDFHKWRQWSTPHQTDPTVEYFYEGPEEGGTGAVQIWKGAEGSGRMEITNSDANGIEFVSAIMSEVNNGEGAITYRADGDKTHITWKSHGELPWFLRVFGSAFRDGTADYYDYVLLKLKKLLEEKAAAGDDGTVKPDAAPAAAPADAGIADGGKPAEAPAAP